MITMSLPDKRDRINHRAPRLLWQQVADDLRAEMDSGALPVDARLPGELSWPTRTASPATPSDERSKSL
jgi:hypothetical protein